MDRAPEAGHARAWPGAGRPGRSRTAGRAGHGDAGAHRRLDVHPGAVVAGRAGRLHRRAAAHRPPRAPRVAAGRAARAVAGLPRQSAFAPSRRPHRQRRPDGAHPGPAAPAGCRRRGARGRRNAGGARRHPRPARQAHPWPLRARARPHRPADARAGPRRGRAGPGALGGPGARPRQAQGSGHCPQRRQGPGRGRVGDPAPPPGGGSAPGRWVRPVAG